MRRLNGYVGYASAVSLSMSHRVAQVGLEPGERAREEVLAVGGRADAQEEMRAAGVARELDLAAVLVQRGEHLLALADGAAVVRLTMQDQRGRLDAVGVGGGRMGNVPVAALVGSAAEVLRAKDVADVGCAVERFALEDWGAADGGGEAVGLADGPGGHVATVRVAVDAGARGISVRALPHGVHYSHEIREVCAAPVLDHAHREVAAVGAGAARVGVDDEEAVAGEALLHEVEGVAIEAVGAAVNVEHDGVAFRGIEVGRLEQ